MKNTTKPVFQITPPLDWYKKWHDNDHHTLVHWGILLIITVVVWSMLYGRIGDWMNTLNEPGIILKLTKPSAGLALDPQTKIVSIGDTLAVNIILDTVSNQVDGVDIYSLHYDPTLLKVLDDMPKQSGTQILPGKIMPLNAANIVDAKSGTIKFSQVAAGGTSFQGKGVLATVHFKALSAGTAYLKFDFSMGSTIDSNAAYKGKDQLTRVVDAIYTIQKKQ